MILSYNLIEKPLESEVLFSGSKFLGFIKYAKNADEAVGYVKEISKLHQYADHVTYAYLTLSEDARSIKKKFSDDGEPAGTAGRPLLEFLTVNKLYNAVCVVVRYFGGTLLGTGNLARAYASAANKCIEKARPRQKVFCAVYEVVGFYNEINTIEKWAKETDVEILDSEFLEDVIFKLAVPFENVKGSLAALNELLGRSAEIKLIENKFI